MEAVAETCEQHGCTLSWYDDGNPEYGPNPPYLDCPQCRDEVDHPMIECYFCHSEQRTDRMSTVNPADPTTAYHLACGHVVI